MSSKFNLQFLGGSAQIWRQQKPANSMSYSAPGIIVRRIGGQGQSWVMECEIDEKV